VTTARAQTSPLSGHDRALDRHYGREGDNARRARGPDAPRRPPCMLGPGSGPAPRESRAGNLIHDHELAAFRFYRTRTRAHTFWPVYLNEFSLSLSLSQKNINKILRSIARHGLFGMFRCRNATGWLTTAHVLVVRAGAAARAQLLAGRRTTVGKAYCFGCVLAWLQEDDGGGGSRVPMAASQQLLPTRVTYSFMYLPSTPLERILSFRSNME
jgi:hypothetical protein